MEAVGITPPAGSFKTFEDVKSIVDQLSDAVEKCAHAAYLKDQVVADHYPLPLISSTIEGCIESARIYWRRCPP